MSNQNVNFQSFKLSLASQLSGYVFDQDDVEFAETTQIDNGRISLTPKLVVLPQADQKGSGEAAIRARADILIKDVQTTVKMCAENNVRLTVKSGGHSAAGYCLNEKGVVLDLRNLDWCLLDEKNETAQLGIGQRFSRVYDFIELNRDRLDTRPALIPIGGGCPTVGLGGFLLGGGYSFLSRSYGMGSDNVKRFRLVTADGKLHNVGDHSTDDQDRELFWGLRGAGGGNFGVTVDTELKLHRPNEVTLLFGNILFPFHRTEEVMAFYNEWAPTLCEKMAVYGYFGSQPDPRMANEKSLFMRFTPIFNGSYSEGIELLQPLLKLGPTVSNFYNMTLPEFEDLIGYGTVVSGRSAYIRSVAMNEGEMTPEVATIFMKYMTRRPSNQSFVVWTHTGGAINRGPETCYPHRGISYVPEIKAIWPREDTRAFRRNVEWAFDFYNELGSHGVGAYINYIDPLQRNWRKAYFGENYDRLAKLQKAIDPSHFFSFQQAVGSDFDPDLDSQPLDLRPLYSSGA